MFKADPKRHPSCSHLMLLPRAASLAPLGVFFYSQWGACPPPCFLFSVFQNARPPATPRRLGPPQTERSKTLGPARARRRALSSRPEAALGVARKTSGRLGHRQHTLAFSARVSRKQTNSPEAGERLGRGGTPFVVGAYRKKKIVGGFKEIQKEIFLSSAFDVMKRNGRRTGILT